jgi:GT2 family glycosyltransferase
VEEVLPLNRADHAPVAVVVLNWNGYDDTARCLRTLRTTAYPNAFTVLVDNASTDGSWERLSAEFPDVLKLRAPDNLGYAGGNNLGIRRGLELGAEYVYVINNDTEVPADSIGILVAVMEADPSIGQVTPKVHDATTGRLGCVGGEIDWRLAEPRHIGGGEEDRGQFDGIADVGYAPGTAVMVRRAALEAVGLIPEQYFIYFEDTVWSLRFQRAGWRTVAMPAASILHHESATMGQNSPRKLYYLIRNNTDFLREWVGAEGESATWRRFRWKLAKLVTRNLLAGGRAQARAIVAGYHDGRAGALGRATRPEYGGISPVGRLPTPGASPRVTAVVLTYNAFDLTADCLRSLEAQDYPNLGVLLVDNASPDASGERLHRAFPDVPYLQVGENLGYAGGNNRGIERALADGCDHVLVINNDTLLEPDAVRRLVEVAEGTPDAGALGPKILYDDDRSLIWFAGGEMRAHRAMGYHRMEGRVDRDPEGGRPEDVTFLTGCCMLVPAPVLRRVGAFQDDFFIYVEDVDFSLKLLRSGYRLLYVPSARIYHRCPRLMAPPSVSAIEMGTRNRRRMARRRLGLVDRARFALFFYPSRVVRIAQYLGSRDVARAGALLRGLTAR